MKVSTYLLKTTASLALLALCTQLAGAVSGTWLASPQNNNWISPATTNNWSSGIGTFPGNTAGSSTTDIASFTNHSTITTINCASGFAVGGMIFDTTNCSAYTINTSGGTWRLNTGNATIHVTGTVTNKQTITGSLRLASTGTALFISDATNPAATLNITSGASANNSGTSGLLILGGTNVGPNICGAYIEQTPASIFGSLTKTNSGTWLMTGNNTHHGSTTIVGGTLMLMGSGAIPNSTNLIVNGATFVVSNTMSNPNIMFVTNSASLVLTNTTVTASPLTIGTLNVSNAVLHLGVNGSTLYSDITVQTALNAGPNTTLSIDQLANVASATTFTLISYAGPDPSAADFTVNLPAKYMTLGYTVSPVSVGSGQVNVMITPPATTSLVWVGATNSVLVSNWDTNKTKNWVDAATLSTPEVFINLDPVQFDDTALNSTVTLLTTNAPNGVTVINNSLNYKFNGIGKITGATALTMGGTATLTLGDNGDDFSGGIALNSGTLILDNTNGNISGGLTIASGSTAQIGNNDAYGALPSGPLDDEGTLIFSRSVGTTVANTIGGGGALTQNGNGTLTLTASNGYAGVTLVSKGTLALSGAGKIVGSPGLLVSNATFDVSGIAGTTTLNDLSVTNASLNVGSTTLAAAISTTTLEADGIVSHSNIINVLALPGFASFPDTITLITSANPITLANGNFNFALGSLPATFSGYLSEGPNDTNILLTLTAGTTGARPPIIWTGVVNTSATTNWTDGANWQLPGAPTSIDSLIFDSTTTVGNATTNNNIVNTSFTVAGLSYINSNSLYQVTEIPAGNTLTVSSNFTVGGYVADGAISDVAFNGGGTLVVNAVNSNLVGNSGLAAAGSTALLDLSALSNFVYNASSATLGVGNLGGRGVGNLNLAGVSNSITAGTLAFETAAASSSVTATTILGAGTNIINASTINLAAQRSSDTLKFPTGVTTAGLRLRGTGGTDADRATIVLGNRNAGGSSGTANGTLSLNGNLVDMKIATLTLGECNQVSPVTGSGTLSFNQGTVDATAIKMAINSNTGTSIGTVNVGGGTLIVGSGGISLVNQTAGSATGNLNLTNASVVCSNSIVKATNGTANLSLTDGSLNMVAGTIGTLALPIDNVYLSDSGALDTSINLNVVVGVTNIAAATVTISTGITTINVASIGGLPAGATAEIPLISYSGTSPQSGLPTSGLALGTTPPGYTGASLVDSGTSIDLVITAPAPLVWVGAVGSVLNSSWNFSTVNWLQNGTPSAYANIDYPLFDDAASNSTVTLTTSLTPATLNVSNNVLNYTFNGAGEITGPVQLVKQGTASLTLTETGGDNFSGGLNVGNAGGTVVLDDANGAPTGGTTIGTGSTVQVGNNDAKGVLPTGNVTNNGTLIYEHTDNPTVAGVISGTGSISQSGSGILTLSNANTFIGAVSVATGTLKGGTSTSFGVLSNAITVASGATLDDNGQNLSAYTNLTVSGSGVGGLGAIVNNGAVQTTAFGHIILAGNTTIGGTNRWDLRLTGGSLLTGGQPYSLTKVGTNQISIVDGSITIDQALSNIVIQAGTFALQEVGVNGLGTNGAITVYSNATFEVDYTDTLTNTTKPIVMLDGSEIFSGNGANSIADPVVLSTNTAGGPGVCAFNINSPGISMTLSNVVSGPGGLVKSGASNLVLTVASTYTGNTVINAGTLTLSGNGSIISTNITVAAGATLNAQSRVDQTLTLNANQTLNGFGTVTGIVTSVTGSTIAPGSPSSLGVLTLAGNVNLGGTNTMKLSTASGVTNDVLAVGGTLQLGGTLNVSLLGGTLVAGDTFNLYKASGGISGTFAATNLPALSGLGWVTTNLANGVLSLVTTVSLTPPYITNVVSGSTLTLSWPADHTGWRLQVQTNSLASGLNPASSAWYTVSGSTTVNSVNTTLDLGNGTVFYRLVYP
jgi:autotransporter-associated beta strand protein